MGKYFGTDGFRGEANKNLRLEHAVKIGEFLGWYYTEQRKRAGNNERARILIGKDSRRSSYMLESALTAGVVAAGADAYLLHLTTTPSVAYLTRTDRFDCGIMISASHNPFFDNGIKLINSNGEKMNEEIISLVENYLDGKVEVFGKTFDEIPLASKDGLGQMVDCSGERDRYARYLIALGRYAAGKKVGLDCANGASWRIAKAVFESLGATVMMINDAPNGVNINENAGSTHIEGLQKFVVENGLDVGFAFDGDADRCLCVDENGAVINGDQILYIYAKYLHERGEFETNTVVTTVMSNLGLYKALDKLGIQYAKTAVGDKYVYEYMRAHGNLIGGEQSGHIIFSKYATTGDGILTSVKMMEVMLEKNLPLSILANEVKMFPQSLINVRVADKKATKEDPDVVAAVKEVETALGDSGRILLRESGTEPVVRVMVEAEEQEICDQYARKVADVIIAKGHQRA